MDARTGARIDHDAVDQPRQERAEPHRQAERDAVTREIHVAAADAPEKQRAPAPARQQQREQRIEIGVIHPALHHVGRFLAQQPRERDEPRHARHALAHAQRDGPHAGLAQPLELGAAGAQRDDDRHAARAAACDRQVRQHALGATGLQTGYDVQHLHLSQGAPAECLCRASPSPGRRICASPGAASERPARNDTRAGWPASTRSVARGRHDRKARQPPPDIVHMYTDV